MVTKFLNASTYDGFNPYRINQDGVDWEIPQPGNPWSGYGYWGDHQIVYLNRLIELLDKYAPEDLAKLFDNDIFTYVDDPYEIVPYADIVKNSKNTIIFNYDKNKKILDTVEKIGTDGKLLSSSSGIYHVSFVEKLLVPILSKISNLVPGGGIWMNTMRPEWNDANNAIVGNGLSMVTVYQLYRHLNFCLELLERLDINSSVEISNEVVTWFEEILKILENRSRYNPREFLDAVGIEFEEYRIIVSTVGLTGKGKMYVAQLRKFLILAIDTLKDSIRVNKRDDGMYHSYNILTISESNQGDLSIEPMFLMLEGQTAILSSGYLSPKEALTLTEIMENSDMMSDEHQQFFLYP
jgi:hypothetical protein